MKIVLMQRSKKAMVSCRNNIELKSLYPLLWSKLDILCKGIHPNEISKRLYDMQNPHETERTGNNGLQIKLGVEKIPLNVAVTKEFCSFSPYYIEIDQSNNLILRNEIDNSVLPISCPRSAPSWYSESVLAECEDEGPSEDGTFDRVVGDLVVLEGDCTAIASITKGCIYINDNCGCKFCAIGKLAEDNVQRSKKLMKAISIMADDQNIRNFHLTGGNDYQHGRGLLRYLPFVEQIRKYRNDARIAVEFTPPEREYQKDYFKQLRNAGADSITMNIEFWNDNYRLLYMPRKGMIPKEEYISAFELGLEIFGPNKVTCGFIVGLEPLEDTFEGIQEITGRGIIAEVYPYKSNDGSELAKNDKYRITETAVIMEASLFANECMKASNIRPDICSGCVKCGACGITQELFKLNCQ